MLKMKLLRRGRKNAPCYDITVGEARKSKIVEKIGYYQPRLKTDNKLEKFVFKMDRVDYWLSQGAQPTEVIERVLKAMKTAANNPVAA